MNKFWFVCVCVFLLCARWQMKMTVAAANKQTTNIDRCILTPCVPWQWAPLSLHTTCSIRPAALHLFLTLLLPSPIHFITFIIWLLRFFLSLDHLVSIVCIIISSVHSFDPFQTDAKTERTIVFAHYFYDSAIKRRRWADRMSEEKKRRTSSKTPFFVRSVFILLLKFLLPRLWDRDRMGTPYRSRLTGEMTV